MNLHSPRPDRSPEAVEQRRKAADRARAKNRHQGYRHDPILENANDRWIAGEITTEQFRQEVLSASTKR